MNKQKGFTLVEGLLIVLIITVVGFAGYYVWNQQSENNTSEVVINETTNDTPQEVGSEVPAPETELSERWERYLSGKGNISLKIADGLNGLRDTTTDTFIFRTYTSADTPAVVEDVDGHGSDGFTAVLIYTDETSNIYTPTEQLNLKSESFITASGVEGTKSSFDDPYDPPCEGLGCYLGYKNVMYDFVDESSGTTTRVWYSRRVANEETMKVDNISQDDPNFTAQIDAMVKTLEFN